MFCGFDESKVIDSRSTEEGEAIRRRRECLQCGKRFTTYEKVEVVPLVVIKKDNSRQPFNRDKLMSGLMRACEKRPVGFEQLERVVDALENQLYNEQKREIRSRDIGEFVLSKLKNIDPVAYVRFASVYKEFKDVNTFLYELKLLVDER